MVALNMPDITPASKVSIGTIVAALVYAIQSDQMWVQIAAVLAIAAICVTVLIHDAIIRKARNEHVANVKAAEAYNAGGVAIDDVDDEDSAVEGFDE